MTYYFQRLRHYRCLHFLPPTHKARLQIPGLSLAPWHHEVSFCYRAVDESITVVFIETLSRLRCFLPLSTATFTLAEIIDRLVQRTDQTIQFSALNLTPKSVSLETTPSNCL